MLLKEENRTMRIVLSTVIAISLLAACKPEKTAEELSLEEFRAKDSVRKVRQKRQGDSLKKLNPLLIVPPDSGYTGDYVDKYPGGVIKFKGFFRFGQRHGQWFSFYPTGLKWSELTFDNGIKDGPNVAYYPNGRKRYEGFYKKDLQDSIWVYYDTAEKVMERYKYKMGQPVEKLKPEASK
jgi:antitoxin component YwqK of YwqJK toxin-antitoxin module